MEHILGIIADGELQHLLLLLSGEDTHGEGTHALRAHMLRAHMLRAHMMRAHMLRAHLVMLLWLSSLKESIDDGDGRGCGRGLLAETGP